MPRRWLTSRGGFAFDDIRSGNSPGESFGPPQNEVPMRKSCGPAKCASYTGLTDPRLGYSRTSWQNTLILQRKLRLARRWRESVALVEYSEKGSQQLEDAPRNASVIVAIPAFNEGATIGSVVLKARRYGGEVVVVDDGSSDGTAETATLAGAHVIRHARNLGNGMAIRSAWLYARERELEAFVLLDGDHQHNPKDIPRIVEPILAGNADVVLGVRWGKTSGMPLYRRIGKRALDYATATATKNGMLTD